MATITLNGLYPGKGEDPRMDIKSTLVAVYLSRKYNTPDAELLFEASPDKNGTIIREISDKYIGQKITIVLCDLKFNFQNIEKTVEELGVFYTYRLDIDYCYSGEGVAPKELEKINTSEMHSKSQEEMTPLIRASRYKNNYIKYGSLIISFAAPLIGLVVAALPGVVIGLLVSVILHFMTPYISGYKKFK